jgi:hypothetical protein
MTKLTPPALQHACVHFQRVNCLRDNPMTHSSVEWIMSLNWLSHFGGKSTLWLAVAIHPFAQHGVDALRCPAPFDLSQARTSLSIRNEICDLIGR